MQFTKGKHGSQQYHARLDTGLYALGSCSRQNSAPGECQDEINVQTVDRLSLGTDSYVLPSTLDDDSAYSHTPMGVVWLPPTPCCHHHTWQQW